MVTKQSAPATHDEQDFYDRCYTALGITSFIITCVWGLYLLQFLGFYAHPGQRGLFTELVVASVVLQAIVVGSALWFIRSDSKVYKNDVDSSRWRPKFLPFSTICYVVGLGLIIICSGGAQNSEFSHFLVATSTLSIVFARKTRTRIAILIFTVSLYVLSSYFNYQPLDSRNQSLATLFDIGCLLLAIIAAAITAWKISIVRTAETASS